MSKKGDHESLLMTTICNLKMPLIVLVCAINVGAIGNNASSAKTHRFSEGDDVPGGLAKSDWQSIRAAYEAGRHAFMPIEGGWQALNPGQAWLTKFDGKGFSVTPDAGGWSWGLELTGDLKVLDVQPESGKISYLREDGVTEWFINDNRGLEQGWTLAKRPEQAKAGALFVIELAVRGSLRPQVSKKGDCVAFVNDVGRPVLTYGGLRAWDAEGKAVDARFASGVGKEFVSVVVDDSYAVYPITIDPIAQQAYLKASNTDGGDDFGRTVAVSGNTVVVGAFKEASNSTGVNGNQDNNSAIRSGAAYVFVRSEGVWTQQAYLKGSNSEGGDQFGYSVAISGDTVVVGANNEASSATGVNGNQTDNLAIASGAAYVFVRSGTTWSQQAYFKAANSNASDQFGISVAVSEDTVVVGAHGEDSSATGVNGNQADNSAEGSGAAYVFVRSGTIWGQQAYLKASNSAHGDQFGVSVGVFGDTLAVGAGNANGGATGVNGNQSDFSLTNAGAAYVFVRSGNTWAQQAYLKSSNPETEDFFGESVAVFGDTVVVGATGEDSGATGVNGNQVSNSASRSGSAYVFIRSEGVWTQQAYLKASNTGGNDYFGHSVAVYGDTVVVGAYQEDSVATGVNGDQSNNVS